MTAVVLFSTWPFLSKADIPVETHICNMTADDVLLPQSDILTFSACDVNPDDRLEMRVSFAIYWVNLIAFFGWWSFVFCAGLGITGIPLSLILQFRTHRPR